MEMSEREREREEREKGGDYKSLWEESKKTPKTLHQAHMNIHTATVSLSSNGLQPNHVLN